MKDPLFLTTSKTSVEVYEFIDKFSASYNLGKISKAQMKILVSSCFEIAGIYLIEEKI